MDAPRSLTRLLAGALLVLAASDAARAARGRDVTAGYEWLDSADGALPGPSFFDGLPTTLTPVDNSPPTPVTLPWAFPFYGGAYTTAWISDNGWLSFADPAGNSQPAPETLPSAPAPALLVAPLWRDLDFSDTAPGRRIIHGPVNAQGAYRFVYSGTDVATGQPVSFELHLYRDGRIKLHHVSGADLTGATIGIQDGSRADGFSVVDRGTPAPGVPSSPGADYAVDILPPPLLPAECSLVPAAACGTVSDSLPGALPANIATYSCDAGAWWARERIHAFTLATGTRFQVTLAPGTGRNLAMHLLQQCSERQCLAGPATSIDMMLAPGRYYLSVDAPAQSDEGSYTLQADCPRLGEVLACGDSLVGDTTSGTNLFFNPPCGGTLSYSGQESIHVLNAAVAANIRAVLTTAADPLMDVLLYRVPATGPVSDADCILRGDRMVLVGDAPPGEYLVVVDGVNGAQGAFSLETSCAVEADCSALAGTIDFTSGNRQFFAGDTTTGVAHASLYSCDLDGAYDGAELVYELVLPRAGQVAIHELGPASGLRYFVLDSCNEGTCLGGTSGSCGFELGAGVHYLAVDEAAGAEGPFSAEIVLDDAFGHWSGCEDTIIPTRPGDTVSTEWHFDDGAYCWSDPASHNYPSGCTFAMYVAVRCGTAFHIPLFDVESGHVRIFDVFRDQYVQLVARSDSGWTATGDDISWEDCTGDLPEWNMVTTDVVFENTAGLCGVYRLEFPRHSGFEWNLYANCTGTNVPDYPIYDTLCGALDAYEPLPELHLVATSADVSCPDVTVHYTLVNDGCADASNVAVALFDDTVEVQADVVPFLAAGSSVSRSFAATFPGGASSANVTVRVDASGLIDECGEVPGAGCVAVPGQDVLQLPSCLPPCTDPSAGVELLPRVGPTLRVGWPGAYSQTQAPLRWGSDTPIDAAAEEHFHVLRSDSPSAGFAQIDVPDPPLLQSPAYVDAAADQADSGTQVWFYFACVANSCHGDNRTLD